MMKARDELKQITDKDAWKLGLTGFVSVEYLEVPGAIEFCYQGGKKYTVPLGYFRTWFPAPHDRAEIAGGDSKQDAGLVSAELVGTGGACAKVALGDGSIYYVAWDLVLMACEPRYVHYGGFTEESQRNTARWAGLEGPRSLRVL